MMTWHWKRIRGHVFGTQGLKKLVGLFGAAVLLWTQGGCAMSLLNASAAGDTEALAVLLHDGHDANDAFPLIGTRPLMVAAANGHIETVKALLDAGADINAEDVTGWTALHAGAFNGDAPLVSLLLARGAVPSKARWFLLTPAKIAERLDHKDIIPLLERTDPPAGDTVSSPPAQTSGH